MLDGVPVFKLVSSGITSASLLAHSVLIWISIGLIVIALFLHLRSKRHLKNLAAVLPLLYAIIICTHFWGQTIKDSSILFSPLVYADGKIFNSIGDAFIYSMAMFLTICAVFMTRTDLYKVILKGKTPKKGLSIYAVAVSIAIAGLIFYSH